MTLKSEYVPLENKLGKYSPFLVSKESEIILFCLFLLNFAFSSSVSQNELIVTLDKTFT